MKTRDELMNEIGKAESDCENPKSKHSYQYAKGKLDALLWVLGTEMECNHQYREHLAAPLGVSCIKCGDFIGAYEA